MENRTHRKILVVDGKVGFTGGVGIADNWTGNAESPEHWRDTHFRATGPVVAQLQSAFVDNWLESGGELRGGWTWYTGSAGWMYRLIVESLLGLKREADRLRFEPCLPATWESVRIDYRYRETTYHITIVQFLRANAAMTVTVDSIAQPDGAVSLVDDGLEHLVAVSVPAATDRADFEDLPISAARMAAPPALA